MAKSKQQMLEFSLCQADGLTSEKHLKILTEYKEKLKFQKTDEMCALLSVSITFFHG
jgi:hypothetical protein